MLKATDQNIAAETVEDGAQALPLVTKPKSRQMLSRILRDYLKNYTKSIVISLFFMVISALMTAGFAKIIEPVLNEIMINKREDLVLPISLAVLGCFVVRGISTYIHTVIMGIVGQGVIASIQNDLFARFLSLDLAFFHSNPSGALIARVVSDVRVVSEAIVNGFTGFGKSLLTLIFLVILMFWQDWKLSLIAFVFIPLAAVFVVFIGKKLRKMSGKIQEQVAILTSDLSEIFKGIRQVKAYGMENAEQQRIEKSVDRYRKLVIKTHKTSNLSTPFNEILLGLALMGLIVYGGYKVAIEELTAGAFMSFIAAFSLAYEPMKRLAKLSNTIQLGLGAAERVFDMLDREPAIQDKPDAKVLKAKTPEIIFENVAFQYNPEDEGYALKGVSFTVPAKKVTALVGPSGSGKTTAMNLVARFYDVTEGKLTIDGLDIRDVTVASLREHMALVSQDITIFDDSVTANIAYGAKDASPAQVKKAAKAAAAHEFIEQLSDGYDTRLGEHGVKLSGGQKQRLALARAILRNAPILLLDEATSALDNESEKAIQKSLEKFMKNRTVLVIAHRLSTVRDADQIIVLDEGGIAEQGTHEELMKKKQGIYARMHAAGFKEVA